MSVLKPITIIGGGLAGLTLGIGLRQQGIPAAVLESGHYPRHRVCGEFISGRGQEVLKRLGLNESFREAGAICARTAVFFAGRTQSPARSLLPPALCLSRFKMDALLADAFRKLGGELREGARWRQDATDAGLVHANGRRVQPLDHGWRWFGLKVHARKISLEADLEMHLASNGYVGMCQLSDGEVNVCGLFRRHVHGDTSSTHWKELLSGEPGTELRRRFADAVFDESSFCSVAGLLLRPQRASESDECRIGDALTMIAPVTGNGMSMAFESAESAIGPLMAYSRGDFSWREAQQAVATACDSAFARRLRWSSKLQWMMFAQPFRGGLVGLALHSDWLWRSMFSRTRD